MIDPKFNEALGAATDWLHGMHGSVGRVEAGSCGYCVGGHHSKCITGSQQWFGVSVCTCSCSYKGDAYPYTKNRLTDPTQNQKQF